MNLYKIALILKKPSIRIIISVVLGLLVSGIILVFSGYPAIKSLVALWNGIFSSPKYISNVLIKSTPIIFTGLSVAFAFKTGLFNIGVEGQFILGALASTLVGISFDFHPIIQIPLVLLAGILAGASYGKIVGFLKAKFGIHEVISGIMMNWIALYLSNFICLLEPFRNGDSNGTYKIGSTSQTMILGAWKKTEEGKAFLETIPYIGEAILKTDFNIGIFISILMAIVLAYTLIKTTKGFELRAVGFNKDAAEAVGIDIKKNIKDVMLISGAIAGLGAALYIMGNSPHKITVLSAFEGFGINGLAVALIAGSSPIGCIFAGLLFGGLMYGGQALQYEVGAPTEIINIVIGIIVFFVAIMKNVPSMLMKIPRKDDLHDK